MRFCDIDLGRWIDVPAFQYLLSWRGAKPRTPQPFSAWLSHEFWLCSTAISVAMVHTSLASCRSVSVDRSGVAASRFLGAAAACIKSSQEKLRITDEMKPAQLRIAETHETRRGETKGDKLITGLRRLEKR